MGRTKGKPNRKYTFTKPAEISLLKGWDRAIAMAQNQVIEMKRSITTFEDLRDEGMVFPEPADEAAPRQMTSLVEVGEDLIGAACHWDETYSITSECRMKAAISTYRWAEQWLEVNAKTELLREMVKDVEEKFYRHYEFNEPLPEYLTAPIPLRD